MARSLATHHLRSRAREDRWRRFFVIALGLCAAVFLANLLWGEVGPASVWGLSYGIAAALLMLLAALYGLRRRSLRLSSRRGLGTSRGWLLLHVYGGGLFLLLMLMHSGFRLPSGVVTGWLWWLSLWTVASGLGGLFLQRWIPRVLGSGLGIEVLYERIPELVTEIRAKAENLVANADPAIQALYERSVAPSLQGPERRWIFLVDITGGKQARLRDFDYLRGFLPGAEKKKLGELARLYKNKQQIDAHYTLQSVLRGWLYAHVPLSVLLVLLLAMHLISVFYY